MSAEPVITVKLRKGLADRNRLSLVHFLTVLDEFRQMMVSVGKRIQRERGSIAPTGDFGLEIIAEGTGGTVKPGSVWSPLAITSNIGIRGPKPRTGPRTDQTNLQSRAYSTVG
jgi:hypothetical protein